MHLKQVAVSIWKNMDRILAENSEQQQWKWLDPIYQIEYIA